MADSFAAGLVGIVLDGRYRLDAVIGEGGMGAVFRATHLAMDRRVAVKLLKPHLTQDETQLERFAREARSTLRVDSPHAVKVLDFGITPQRDCYIALEYLDGRTVQRELDVDGPFAPARAVHVARQALHALGAAHRRGLVHRDVKPDNLMLLRVGADPDYTKVLDFGVAKLMEGAPRSARSALALTQTGMVFGTPEFMSPEQACGHPLDGRSDLYSLAATLFAMLTGYGLFAGKSPIEWLTHHARTPPPHLADARPALAAYPELDALLQRCLAKHREQRPRDAEELDGLLAAIAPALAPRAGAGPAGAGARASTGFAGSDSGFLDALPPSTVDAGETLLPPAPGGEAAPPVGAVAAPVVAAAAPSTAPTAMERPLRAPPPAAPAAIAPPLAPPPPAASIGLEAPLAGPPRGRAVAVAIGAIGAVALLGVAVGVALTRDRAGASGSASATASGSASATASGSASATASGSASVTASASTSITAAVGPAPAAGADARGGDARDAGAPPPRPDADAAPAPRPAPRDAGARPLPPRRPAPPAGSAGSAGAAGDRRRAEQLLEQAAAALATDNRLDYLFYSESAHAADPRSARARLTYADALIRTGNTDRGCQLLRALRGQAAADALAAAARCPTD